MIATARAALLAALAGDDALTLPARQHLARVRGASGTIYEATHAHPEEHVKLRAVTLTDTASAVVTLDDGRELLVLLVGAQSPSQATSAAIQVVVDDPLLAAMSPAELRARMRLLMRDAAWRCHWHDTALAEEAGRLARERASSAFDWAEGMDGADVEPGTQGSPAMPNVSAAAAAAMDTQLLARAGAILLRENRLMLPDIEAVVPARGSFTAQSATMLLQATLVRGGCANSDSGISGSAGA